MMKDCRNSMGLYREKCEGVIYLSNAITTSFADKLLGLAQMAHCHIV